MREFDVSGTTIVLMIQVALRVRIILEQNRFFSLIFVAAAVAVVKIHRSETMQQVGSDVAFALI